MHKIYMIHHKDLQAPTTMRTPVLDMEPTAAVRRDTSLALFTEPEARILAILMVVFSTVSIVAGSLGLYWFVRMRRAFRHHLIILLILSNLWRALWYFLFPIVSFTRGTIETKSTYCQLSGFMLSFGIQGADFVVLVMAIHAALCVFNTSSELRESGLYPYRRTVYVLWIAFPALCAGLAFINEEPGYATTGAYCYLPVFPIWYRLALSWIPRYIILISIAVIYLSIFLYVRRKFAHFRLSHRANSYDETALKSSMSDQRGDSLRMSPMLDDPDAIESAAPTLLGSVTPHLSERSSVPPSSVDLGKQSGVPLWEDYTFGASVPIAQLPDSATLKPDRSKFKPWPPRPSDRRDSSASRESVSNIILALEQYQPTEPREFMRSRHRAINRQMRMVFIYPLLYWFSWIVPFISHCFNYDDSYARHPNLGLLATANVILALQCAIDTLLFSLREKPWRAQDTENETAKTFLGSIMPWRGREPSTYTSSTVTRGTYERSSIAGRSLATAAAQKAAQLVGGNSSGNGAGRSKGQNVAEAMAAKQRKTAETAEARQEAKGKQRERQVSLMRRGGAERSWWEVEGKRRNDSVLLGDYGRDSGKGIALSVIRTRTQPSIGPIGEESEEERPIHRRPSFIQRISEGVSSSDAAAGSSSGDPVPILDTSLQLDSVDSEVSPKQRTPQTGRRPSIGV